MSNESIRIITDVERIKKSTRHLVTFKDGTRAETTVSAAANYVITNSDLRHIPLWIQSDSRGMVVAVRTFASGDTITLPDGQTHSLGNVMHDFDVTARKTTRLSAYSITWRRWLDLLAAFDVVPASGPAGTLEGDRPIYITRDGIRVSPLLADGNAGHAWLLRHTSTSTDHALKHEGYGVEVAV